MGIRGLFSSKKESILQALKENDRALALRRLRKGGDLNEKDEHGNVALHYAAAFGYLDLIEEIIRTGFRIDQRNDEEQTPLVYAMEYDQPSAAELLWRYQRFEFEKRSDADAQAELELELCNIGVKWTLAPGKACSGFFMKDSPLKYGHHPRVRRIGESLHSTGGISAMRRVHASICDLLGSRAAHDLSACWHKVGEWLH